jgi:hypothetical protein
VKPLAPAIKHAAAAIKESRTNLQWNPMPGQSRVGLQSGQEDVPPLLSPFGRKRLFRMPLSPPLLQLAVQEILECLRLHNALLGMKTVV